MGFAPDRRDDFRDLVVGQVWQAREDFTEIGVRVEAATAAAFDDGVNNGAALAGPGVADEEPVFLADGGGANGVFDQVVIDLHPAIVQIDGQRGPLAQRIINGLSQTALRKVTPPRLEPEQNFFQPLDDGAAVAGAPGLT